MKELENAETWTELTAPFVRKLEVAAKFGGEISFDAVGSEALARLIKDMSEKLDIAVAREKKCN